MIKKTIKEAVAYSLLQTYREDHKAMDGIVSVFFHDPPKKLFESVLEWLKANGYTFISVKELDGLIHSEGQKPPDRKLAFISFDDAWRGNLELIKSIEKYQAPIAIFVPTEAIAEGNYWWEYAGIKGQHLHTGIKDVESFKKLPGPKFRKKIKTLKERFHLHRSSMTKKELVILSKHGLVTLGSHTVTHPILEQCTPERQAFELIESKNKLSEWLNHEIEYLAYPNGDFDEHTLKIAHETGYRLCFSTLPGRINVENVNPYIIPRNSIEDDQGYYESISKLLGVWQKFKSPWNRKPGVEVPGFCA